MWSLFTGRRGNGNLPQREPLWKRVERLEESVGKLQKTEKDRLEKERMMKEETKTQELLEKMKKEAKEEAIKEVSNQFGMVDPWAAGHLSSGKANRKRDPSPQQVCHDAPVKRSKVMKVEDINDVLRELGVKKPPTGRFAIRNLAENLVARKDFVRKNWQKMADNVLEDKPPQGVVELAAAVLEAIQD